MVRDKMAHRKLNFSKRITRFLSCTWTMVLWLMWPPRPGKEEQHSSHQPHHRGMLLPWNSVWWDMSLSGTALH